MDRTRPADRGKRAPARPGRRSVAFCAALLLIGLSSPRAKAEVRCSSSASSPNNFAEIGYSSRTGLDGPRVLGNATATHAPDNPETGQQLFSTNAGTSTSGTTQTFDLPNGRVHSSSDTNPQGSGGSASAGSRGYILDKLTFHNTTGQPAKITVTWAVAGSFGATRGDAFSRATYYSQWHMESFGFISNFIVTGYRDNNPNNDTVQSQATGWDSFNIDNVNSGFNGATFSGVFTVGPGDVAFNVYGLLDTAVVGDASAFSHFGNTAALHLTLPPGVSFTSTDGMLNAGSRIVNISSRADVRTGDNAEIAGFIVTGNAPKKVILRGLGPSLAASGVTGGLADPVLELNQNGTILAANDNWKDSQQTEIQNSGLAPGSNLESAIVRTLNPGSYTATLRGKNNGTGIGLIEVYDLEPGADSRLANMSTRAFIDPGDHVLIAGIIGGGNGSQPKVLINARGPSLAASGVSNPIPDPLLELHDKNGGLIASNNDWQSDQKDAIGATGVGPTDARESALLATLVPAENYTAIVKDANGASGVALVEVYHLQ
jgi:hypothetical protein